MKRVLSLLGTSLTVLLLPLRLWASPLDLIGPTVTDLLETVVHWESTETKTSFGIVDLFGVRLLNVEIERDGAAKKSVFQLLLTPLATLLSSESQSDPTSPISTSSTNFSLVDSPLAGLLRATSETLPGLLGEGTTESDDWMLLDPGVFNLAPLVGQSTTNGEIDWEILFLLKF